MKCTLYFINIFLYFTTLCIIKLTSFPTREQKLYKRCEKDVLQSRAHHQSKVISPTTLLLAYQFNSDLTKVKSMQRLGTEASQPSKSKRKINRITNSQNTNRTYGRPSENLFPKRGPLSHQNRTKNDINAHKVKRNRNSDTKNKQQRTTTELPP